MDDSGLNHSITVPRAQEKPSDFSQGPRSASTASYAGTDAFARRLLSAALAFARRGLPVIPLTPYGKAPLTAHGSKDGTTDEETIRRWWRRWPFANIGLCTGAVSGLLVLDIDPERGGEEALAALEEKYGKLPETLEAATGGGGRHLFFRNPNGTEIRNSVGALGPGLDVRAEGGYVVTFPSITEGAYRWTKRAPVEAVPPWLVAELTRPGPRGEKAHNCAPFSGEEKSVEFNAFSPIDKGGRNVALTSLAGRLHDGSRSLAELTDDLRAINLERCSPPLPDEEVAKIARSIRGREPCQPRPMRGQVDDELIREFSDFWYGERWRGLAGKSEARLARALIREARRVGEAIPVGLRVSISVRQLAEILGCSKTTVMNDIQRGRRDGWLRRDDAGRRPGRSGALVLVSPRHGWYTHPRGGRVVGGVPRLSRPGPKSVADLETAHYRHRGPVGYSREHTLATFEAHGPMDAESAADLLGWSRPRDLARLHLEPLRELGLLEKRGDLYGLPGSYRLCQEGVRDQPYSTLQLRAVRQKSPEGKTVSHVRETGSVASELDRARADRAKHQRERMAFLERRRMRLSHHPANLGADGYIEDLSPADAPSEPAAPEPPPLSALAVAIREYLDRNRKDACQAPGWLGLTLWALDLFDGKPSPEQVRAAIGELGGEPYLRQLLDSTRKDVA